MSEKGITGGGAGVMVIKEGKVLLGLRNSDPTKADSALHGEGNWTMPGGKIRFGDTFEQTASRELTEETGLVGNSFKVFSVSNDKVPDAHFITVGLLCDDFNGEPKVMEPDEIVEWRWWNIDKLPSNIFPPSRIMADNYLSGKMYH
jgi:ADP-ribose pyrophosphatase YjhB (NUDIX family)